jgi:enterochelin esterase-like enzyme
VTAAGSLIRRHDAVHSTWLPEARGVTVYLPPGYGSRRASYPVLLLHDGQNLFDPDRAHIRGEHWRVAETADALILARRIEPIVIVGIDHAGEGRIADFTPTAGGRQGAGLADRYAKFVVTELLPFIVRHYSVRRDANGRGLGGSSLGGLVTLFIAQTYPATFGRLLVMSPSVWWDRAAVLRSLRRTPLDPTPRIWLDAGAREGPGTLKDVRKLCEVLQGSAGTKSAELVRCVEDRHGDHSERSWARRFPEALAFLFGARSRSKGRGQRAEGSENAEGTGDPENF